MSYRHRKLNMSKSVLLADNSLTDSSSHLISLILVTTAPTRPITAAKNLRFHSPMPLCCFSNVSKTCGFYS